MKGRTPTAAEKRWMTQVAELNCIVCRNGGLGSTPAAIHHIDGRTKEGAHFKILPLCGIHHQTGGYGVALHQGRVAWENRYGTQKQLLKQVQELLNDR